MFGLQFGEGRRHAGAARVGDAPLRPAPAADGRIGQDQERGVILFASGVAVAEENVLVLRSEGGLFAFGHVHQTAQLIKRVADQHGLVQSRHVRTNRPVRRNHAHVSHAGDIAADGFDGGVGLLDRSLPRRDEGFQHRRRLRFKKDPDIAPRAQIRVGAGEGDAADDLRAEQTRDFVKFEAELFLVTAAGVRIFRARLHELQQGRSIGISLVDHGGHR